MAQHRLEKSRELRLEATKTNLPSINSWKYSDSSYIAKKTAQILLCQIAGSKKSLSGKPGKENGWRRWSQGIDPKRALSSSREAEHQATAQANPKGIHP